MKIVLSVAAGIVLVYLVFLHGDDYPEIKTVDGAPGAILFATDGCGRNCRSTRKFLDKRMEFVEYDAFDDDEGSALYKELGGVGYLPYVVIGDERVVGDSPGGIISAIALEFGPANLPADERRALARHFDTNGDPRVVMYATAWCGYCDQARSFFRDNDVAWVEYDVEKDADARRDFDTLEGSGTPLLYFGYARVSGFDLAQVREKFEL